MNSQDNLNILIHPRRGKSEKTIPGSGLLLVNPSEASDCHRRLEGIGGESRFLFNSALTVVGNPQFFIAGPAIGSPMAVLAMEKLIVLGAKKLILFGWCGSITNSLKIGDILIPSEAQSGEGTSQYYPLSFPACPSRSIRENLEQLFLDNSIHVHSGRVWSTDAVYREERPLLQTLHTNDHVVAVDMEFSALCTVACFRNIEFAAVLIVSDELSGEAWKPGFANTNFHQSKRHALDILLSHVGFL